MKKLAMFAACLALSGCLNVMYRVQPMPNNGPYFYTQADAFLVSVPFRDAADYSSRSAKAAFALLLPLTLVDLPLECVVDTLFLPWDLYKGE